MLSKMLETSTSQNVSSPFSLLMGVWAAILEAMNSYHTIDAWVRVMCKLCFLKWMSLQKTNICRVMVRRFVLIGHLLMLQSTILYTQLFIDLKPNTVAYGGLVRIWNLSIITFVVSHNIIAHSHVDYLKILIVVETTSQVTETCTLDTDKFIDYLKL